MLIIKPEMVGKTLVVGNSPQQEVGTGLSLRSPSMPGYSVVPWINEDDGMRIGPKVADFK